MAAESTHPSLLSRVRNPGDQQAWREFETRYARLLVRYAQSRGLQRMDAEDIRQLVFMKLAHALQNFRYDPDRGRFRDYLGRIVKNAIHSHFSRPTRTQSSVGTDELTRMPAPPEGGGDVWEREWMLHHFHLAMRSVRRSFDARSIEMFDRILTGETPDQVAAEFRVSREAVYKVKQRIRQRLKELVKMQIDDEQIPKRLERT